MNSVATELQGRPAYGRRPVQWSGSEAGSYLRLIDSFNTQHKAQGPSRTCNESKEEEEEEDGRVLLILLYYAQSCLKRRLFALEPSKTAPAPHAG